jgi:peptide/nickel transport system substrate-binding protein
VNKVISSLATFAVLAGALAGCSQVTGTASFVPGSSITIGESGELISANSGVATTTASQIAARDLAQLTMPAFFSPDAAGNLTANTDFGTVNYSGSKVTFTLTGKAKWSDGVPVSPADLALSWMAAVNSPATGKADNGFNSNLVATSLALGSNPVLTEKSFSLSFSQPVVDWQTMLPITVPAHLVVNAAFGISDASAAQAKLAELIANGKDWDVRKVGAAYAAIGADQKVTAGAYKIASASSSVLKLTANKDFAWGPKPTVATVFINCYQSTDELLTAIAAKKVDLAAPVESPSQPYPQILNALKSSGLELSEGDAGKSEILLLNHSDASVFSVKGAGGPKKSAAAQQAFFQFAPRTGIWNILLPGSALKRSNSLVFGSAQGDYSDSAANNGTANFKFQDGEASQELWAKSGFDRTIPVRVLFDSNNPRGQLEYTQLQQFGKVSGFTFKNVSTDTPSKVLASGEWDLFIADLERPSASRVGLATAVGSLAGFNEPSTNALVSKLAKQKDLSSQGTDLKILDKKLVAGHYGLPLFELPGVVVHSKKFSSFAGNSSMTQVTYGYSNWSVSASGK